MQNQSESGTQQIEHEQEPEPSFSIRDIIVGILFLATAANGYMSIYALVSVQDKYDKDHAYLQHSRMRTEWQDLIREVKNNHEFF